MILLKIAAFFLAASFVSFFNLFDDRRRRGENWIAGRSRCESCGRRIPWPYLIPVLGYIFCRGRCTCGEKISLYHPLSEGIGGALVVFLLHHLGMEKASVLPTVAVFVMYLLALEDSRHRDVFTGDLVVGGVFLIAALILDGAFHPLSGAFLFCLIGLLYFLFPKAVGEGDIYFASILALGIGEIWRSYLFFTVTFVSAALIGGGLYFFKVLKQQAVPMFPFFLFGFLIVGIYL